MSRVESLTVALGARSYEILVGEGLLAEAAARVAAVLPGRRLVVVTDETVARLHLPALSDALAAAGLAATPLETAAGTAVDAGDDQPASPASPTTAGTRTKSERASIVPPSAHPLRHAW